MYYGIFCYGRYVVVFNLENRGTKLGGKEGGSRLLTAGDWRVGPYETTCGHLAIQGFGIFEVKRYGATFKRKNQPISWMREFGARRPSSSRQAKLLGIYIFALRLRKLG
jgi:hypothetical protein